MSALKPCPRCFRPMNAVRQLCPDCEQETWDRTNIDPGQVSQQAASAANKTQSLPDPFAPISTPVAPMDRTVFQDLSFDLTFQASAGKPPVPHWLPWAGGVLVGSILLIGGIMIGSGSRTAVPPPRVSIPKPPTATETTSPKNGPAWTAVAHPIYIPPPDAPVGLTPPQPAGSSSPPSNTGPVRLFSPDQVAQISTGFDAIERVYHAIAQLTLASPAGFGSYHGRLTTLLNDYLALVGDLDAQLNAILERHGLNRYFGIPEFTHIMAAMQHYHAAGKSLKDYSDTGMQYFLGEAGQERDEAVIEANAFMVLTR